MKSSNLSQAVKLALLSAGTTAIASSPVLAQEEVEEIEEIITTGSRLVRTDLEAVSPIQVVDNEDEADDPALILGLRAKIVL